MNDTMHTPMPVAGYQAQPPRNVERVNNHKHLEEITLRVLDDLAVNREVDQRWLSIGRTHLEQAWMAINRAIFKPARVTLPEDARLPKETKAWGGHD